MPTIRVPFTVTARPSDPAILGDVPVVGLTTFDKLFSGTELLGTSVVQMVSVVGAAGPLAYVALERVEGSLTGVHGSFVLQHVGAITAGVPTLVLDVVPGSGTGGLELLEGSGSIEHTGDGAFLTLTYALPG